MIGGTDATPEARARFRRQHDERLAERREREKADALDYLFHGDPEGRHTKRCIHAVPCSREYNPMPYPEAAVDPRMYEGTGVGLLYGLDGPRFLLLETAGWSLGGKTERSVAQDLHSHLGVSSVSYERLVDKIRAAEEGI